MEQEIDLTIYLDVLIRRWKVIVIVMLALVLAAEGRVIMQPTTYQARVLVATVKPTSQVSFATSEIASAEALAAAQDQQKRLASLVGLVTNPAVADQVLANLREQLPAELRRAPALLSMVRGHVAQEGDQVEIVVTHRDPKMAALVANAWGQAYVRQVSQIDARTAAEALDVVRVKAQAAKQMYDREQAALEEALRRDRFDELSRRLYERQATIADLVDAQQRRASTLLAEMQRLDRLLRDVQGLQRQLRAGGDAAAVSNGPALVLLKAQIFAEAGCDPSQNVGRIIATFSYPQHPITLSQTVEASTLGASLSAPSGSTNPTVLQIQVGPAAMTAEAMAKDLEALGAVLEGRRSALSEELTGLAGVLSGETDAVGAQTAASAERPSEAADRMLDETIQSLEQQARDLRAELAQEDARLREARARRDLAWNRYEQLHSEEIESALEAQTKGATVRVVAPAVTQGSRRLSMAREAVIAAAVGLISGALLALLIEFWQGYRVRYRAAQATQKGD